MPRDLLAIVDEFESHTNSLGNGFLKRRKVIGIVNTINDMYDVMVGDRLISYMRNCLTMEGFRPETCDELAKWIQKRFLVEDAK